MQTLEVGKEKQNVVFIEATEAYVEDRVITQAAPRPRVDLEQLDPLARLGGNDYWIRGEILNIPRPDYKPR